MQEERVSTHKEGSRLPGELIVRTKREEDVKNILLVNYEQTSTRDDLIFTKIIIGRELFQFLGKYR